MDKCLSCNGSGEVQVTVFEEGRLNWEMAPCNECSECEDCGCEE